MAINKPHNYNVYVMKLFSFHVHWKEIKQS